jgi:hypothetical protein
MLLILFLGRNTIACSTLRILLDPLRMSFRI